MPEGGVSIKKRWECTYYSYQKAVNVVKQSLMMFNSTVEVIMLGVRLDEQLE
jgi:hypothetical protein